MNQTDVRTFKAASMQEALDIVRREMGPDAVILHTREVPAPRFLKWRKTSERVEVTAGTGVNVRTPRAMLPPLAPRSARTTAPSPASSRSAYRQNEEALAPPPPLLERGARAAPVAVLRSADRARTGGRSDAPRREWPRTPPHVPFPRSRSRRRPPPAPLRRNNRRPLPAN